MPSARKIGSDWRTKFWALVRLAPSLLRWARYRPEAIGLAAAAKLLRSEPHGGGEGGSG
jgi:hypothetical protein